MTTVAELLEQRGWTKEDLAERVGVKPKTVQSRYQEPVSELWLERLGESVSPNGDEPIGRADEQTPKPPPDARVVEPPPELDFSGLAGYIESAYLMGAEFLVSDPLLADSIARHAKQAGEAWARWAEADPRVAAFLQRMMVGTPLGEVIAVHVGIGAGYFLARATVRRSEAEARRADGQELEPELGGTPLEPEPAPAL